MVLAADYPLMDVFWSILIFTGWMIWFWMVIAVLGDVFRRHDISGWGKAGWSLVIIVLPFLGVWIYLISNSADMAERSAAQSAAQKAAMDEYIRSTAAGTPPQG
jgi:hypothetical protein